MDKVIRLSAIIRTRSNGIVIVPYPEALGLSEWDPKP